MRDLDSWMSGAIAEARAALEHGDVPVGAVVVRLSDGQIVAHAHNARERDGDPTAHAEVDAFRAAGRRPHYRDTVMVTTLAPCFYCSGLVRQFAIPRVIVGESRTFQGGIEWLRSSGVEIADLGSAECEELLGGFIAERPDVWDEDIGI